jgi:amino acid transporter
MDDLKPPLTKRIRTVLIGGGRDLQDSSMFHRLALTAFLAWIGLGADGISSSCYGPPEAFITLGRNVHLGLLVALASAVTVFVISASYSHIIELFPSGGGGYVVASKLLNPSLGMVSGCALLIDYILTITLSVASGTDALFSFLPLEWQVYRVPFAVFGVILLTVMNLRGVKESVMPLIPIMLSFVVLHVFIILYSVGTHFFGLPEVVRTTVSEASRVQSEVGFLGLFLLLLRSYSFGAGTYTGIEAVSNGLPIIREPRVHNGKKTMLYMAISLAFMVTGLMLSYLLYHVEPMEGKTLNAVLFEKVTAGWSSGWSNVLVFATLLSEAALLFVAAQTGFLDAPRVLANMAIDRWFPTRFAMLSDRLVIQNGILLMGMLAVILMIASHGSVAFLVVLYSITVFITFTLSQSAMVRHWWQVRKQEKRWKWNLTVNGVGLVLTSFILITVVLLKFDQGGWLTLVAMALLMSIAIVVRRHYRQTSIHLRRLDDLLVTATEVTEKAPVDYNRAGTSTPECDRSAKTAVLLVNGFNGLGLHTLLTVIRLFEGTFRNFIFIQVGVVDVGNFKGSAEVERLEAHIKEEGDRYVTYMQRHGYYAESITVTGVGVVEEIEKLAPKIIERFPRAVMFGGQLVFEKESFFTRLLHNHTIFAVQKRLYHQGIPIVILPIRV